MEVRHSTFQYSYSVLERVAILIIYGIALFVINRLLSGKILPSSGMEDLWIISAFGFLCFNLLSAPFFVKPSDSLASSLASLLLLWSIDLKDIALYSNEIDFFRWLSFYIMLITLFSSAIAILLQKNSLLFGSKSDAISKISYRFATNLGKGVIVFTPPIMISIFGFHQNNLNELLLLSFTWILIISIRPVELIWNTLKDLRGTLTTETSCNRIGEIIRIDSPNIIRVNIANESSWNTDKAYMAYLANKKKVYVLPLFIQIQENRLVGTGLCLDKEIEEESVILNPGVVYEISSIPRRDEIVKTIIDKNASLVGFVVEDSNISHIRFEVIKNEHICEGCVVFCLQKSVAVYYQVIEAKTSEENFESNPRGTHIITATQLGVLDDKKGFIKYSWLPEMNTPIFFSDEITVSDRTIRNGEFDIGFVPRTKLPVTADYNDILEYHTAILGVTGTGKTELAFDIIREGIKQNSKIFCVDFTGDYIKRLTDYSPVSLGLSPEKITELATLVDDIETGEYNAAKEKKALEVFIKKTEPEIETSVDSFLSPEGPGLGIFELNEIANTRATLRATELYLSKIFKWAKKHRKLKKILVVLEEAHTIIPEMNLFGYDKNDTAAVVGRMSQIALQGRKYGVGILIISQRTALVSKTLLSQCNTTITFSLVDKTSLEYLSSVYSSEHIKIIPNLLQYQALAYGKGINSERPVIIQIPYDQKKREASEALNCSKKDEE